VAVQVGEQLPVRVLGRQQVRAVGGERRLAGAAAAGHHDRRGGPARPGERDDRVDLLGAAGEVRQVGRQLVGHDRPLPRRFGRCRGERCGPGLGRRRFGERAVEELCVQLLERGARFDTQLVHQVLAAFAVHGHRVGRPPAQIQGPHEQPAALLAQRVRGRQLGEPGGGRPDLAEPELAAG
jgi:hypothetical protein